MVSVLWATVIVTSFPVLHSFNWSCQNTTAELLGCTCRNTSSLQVICKWKNLTSLPSDLQLPIFTEHLDISRNSLTTVENSQFSKLYFLLDLNLSWNKLEKLQVEAFSNLTHLHLLNLSHNLLKTLPAGIFKGISKLQKLDLSSNSLLQFDVNIFKDLPYLDDLSLECNNKLGDFFSSVKQPLIEAFNNGLRNLYLGYTNLKRIPKGFFENADNLKALSLIGNPMQHVPSLPGTLEVLDLSGCHIVNISARSFISYPLLQKLVLNNMPNMTEIQAQALVGLTSLDSLSIENCISLRKFDSNAFGDTDTYNCPLRHLSLSRGGLRTLSQDVFTSLTRLEIFNLQGNPWTCDCNLLWLRDINMSSAETRNLRCFFPKKLHNKLLMHVDRDEFSCVERREFEDSYKGTIAATVFLTIFAFVGLGLLLYQRYKGSLTRRSRKVGPIAQTQGYELLDINPNSAEYEWDEMENIWTTSSSNKPIN